MSETKRYYWLKLKKDFFKRHDIKIIEEMDNGKDYILFYLKLLCESVDHEGSLRFSDAIPYSEKMLATITNTNIDIVRNAMRVFTELQMVEILDDATIFMSEVNKMIGSECDSAQRVRNLREKNRLALQCNTTVTNCNTEKEKELEVDIQEDKDKEENGAKAAGSSENSSVKRFSRPSLEDVKAYCQERKNGIDAQGFIDFYTSKGWKVGNQPMKDWKACVRTWERRNASVNCQSTKIADTSKYERKE